jgi:hypothetical protein
LNGLNSSQQTLLILFLNILKIPPLRLKIPAKNGQKHTEWQPLAGTNVLGLFHVYAKLNWKLQNTARQFLRSYTIIIASHTL